MYLVEFHFVDHGGIGRDDAAAFGAEDHFVGEVEAVGGASLHHFETDAQSGKDAFVECDGDGSGGAVGLVEEFAGEHVVAAVVEGDALVGLPTCSTS